MAGAVPAKEGHAMDEAQWTLVDSIGPAIRLIMLIWLVLNVRRRRDG